jgi:hypothetical protein
MTPRRRSPGARARRALAADALLALLLAVVALTLAAGLGVVAFIAVPLLLLGLFWIGVERLIGRIRRRHRPAA